MIKIRNMIVFVFFILLITIQVYAKEDIQVVLEHPAVYSAQEGDKLNYQLKISLPESYEKYYKSFAVTVLMDSNLSVVENKLDGIELVDSKIEVKVTSVKKNTQNLVTLSINDVNVLNGLRNFTLNISTVVKKDTVSGSNFNNSFVLSYVDKTGSESSQQKDITSNTKVQDGKIVVSDVFSKSTEVTGVTEKNSKIKILIEGKKIAEGISDKNGNFKIGIEPQEVGTKLNIVSYFTKDAEDKTASIIVVVKNKEDSYVAGSMVDESIKSYDENKMKLLHDYVAMARDLNVSSVEKEHAARLMAAVANGQYIEVKSKVSGAEIEDAITKLKEAVAIIRKPFMNGYSKTTFGPKNNMKRAEVASVLTKIYLGKDAQGVFSSFSDVSQEAWYADAVGFMEKKGIITGYNNGKFMPEKSITRAEFASIISKFANINIDNTPLSFNDVNEEHWAKNAIDAVTSKGLMNGRGKNLFAPNEPITRAEVATVLNKLQNRTPNKAFMDSYSKNPFKDVSSKFWAYYEILEATGN